MSDPQTAAPGATGGAAAEIGSEYRARVGALLAVAVLRRCGVTELGFPGDVHSPAVLLQAESDDPVDDLVLRTAGGACVYLQAKHTANLSAKSTSALGAAVDQFARAVERGLQPDDRLVLASAHPSGPVQRLGQLLERRRHAAQGALTQDERKAWSAFSELTAACGIDPAARDAIARQLVIWPTDPTTGDGEGLLVTRLEHHVVAAGQGMDAARELTDEVRHLARLRAGRDAVQLAQVLAARGVELHAGAPPSAPAAWARALAEHRRRIVRRGRTLALFGAPPELSNLPLADADAGIRVSAPEDTRSSGQALELALRRRGRALVVGAPGGGKSTALRAAAAHWAERSDWPTPIPVHLQRLAADSTSLTQRLLDAAVDDDELIGADARAALRAALAHELERGRCLLVLDGLDEVRRGREALVDELARALQALPEETEVLVATRPSTAADAQPLGLDELVLRAPAHWRDTASAILDAAAPPSAEETWSEDRQGWVAQAIARDSALGHTPLTVVILALIAARAERPESLPAGRAAVLHRALLDVLDGWEVAARLRGDVQVGPLTDARARHALVAALCTMATAALAGEGTGVDAVRAAVAAELCEGFSLGRLDAGAAAERAVAFWTECGLFSFDGGAIMTVVRQLAELAYGWRPALEGDPPAVDWVAATRGSIDLLPSLALAAGLSEAIAEAWAHAIASDPGVGADEFFALVKAVEDGVVLAPDVLADTAEAAAARLLIIPEAAEQAAEALLRLSLPADARDRLRPQLCAHVPAHRRAVVDVLAITRWDERGGPVTERLRAFLTGPQPPLPDHVEPVRFGEFVMPARDDVYHDAHELAMLRLAAVSRADAERVLEQFSDGSNWFREQLCAAFSAAGHDDLADGVNADLRHAEAEHEKRWSRDDFDGLNRWTFTTLAEQAPPTPLTQLQLRRLGEIADLVETASLNWVYPNRARKRDRELVAWLRSVVVLGRFDAGVIAAQARVVLDDLERGDRTHSVAFDDGRDRTLDGWDAEPDPEARIEDLLVALGGIPEQAGRDFMVALAFCPRNRTVVERLDERLPQFLIWARTLIARTIVLALSTIPQTGADEADVRATVFLDDPDALIRRGAATWWAHRAQLGGTLYTTALHRCLDDPDAGVVADTIAWLQPATVDDALRDRLLEIRAIHGRGWICDSCGHDNQPGGKGTCADCSTSAPDVARKIDKLLERRTSYLRSRRK